MKLSAFTALTLAAGFVLSLAASVPLRAQTADAPQSTTIPQTTKDQQDQLKKDEKANKEKAKAAREQRKALRQQDKAEKAAKKAGDPQK